MRSHALTLPCLLLALAAGAAGCAHRTGVRYAFDLARPEGYLTHANMGFRSGDRFRIRVVPDQDCHLYILNQGTDGQYAMLYPLGLVEGGRNFVQGGHTLQLPPVGHFALDNRPGIEKIIILAAPEPLPPFEAFRGRENNLPPDEVRSAFKVVDSVYNVTPIRRSKATGAQFTSEAVFMRAGAPTLVCDIDIIHQ